MKEDSYANLDIHVTIWNAIIQQLQYRLNQFIDFITQLKHGRLSLTWFTTSQLQRIHNSVIEQAEKHNIKHLTQHLTDYFQLDVSYIRSENFITAIIHVPATAAFTNYKLYRYVPFPIPLSNSEFMTIHADHDIIAVGHDNKHKVLSQTQLNSCTKHYQNYVCETPLITNTNFSTTYIGSLLDHDASGIQTHRSVSSSPSQETVFQITSSQFAIYSPETFTGREHCSNGTLLSALISQISKVTVPPGCNFKLRNHVLSVPLNVISSAEPWVQETKWDTLAVPRQLMVNQLRRTAAIHQLLQQDDMQQQLAQAHLHASAIMLNTSHNAVTQHAKEAHQTVQQHQWYIVALAFFSVFNFISTCFAMTFRYRQTSAILRPKTQPA
jgi:hypothetical protein